MKQLELNVETEWGKVVGKLQEQEWEVRTTGNPGRCQTRRTGGLCEAAYRYDETNLQHTYALRENDFTLTVEIREHEPPFKMINGRTYGGGKRRIWIAEMTLRKGQETLEKQKLYDLREKINEVLDMYNQIDFDWEELNPTT